MKPQRGFTLIELLVASAIFAVVATLSYGGYIAILKQYDGTRTAQQRLQEIRRAVTLLERDLLQVANRPIREAFQGETQPALRGGTNEMLPIEFTRSGWRNPVGLPRASLQRVAWQRDSDILYRLHWRMLDPAQDSEPVRLEVLDGVERFAVRFLDDAGQWHEQWPSLEVQTGPGTQSANTDMPVAMEFIVELEDAGRIRRLVEMP